MKKILKIKFAMIGLAALLVAEGKIKQEIEEVGVAFSEAFLERGRAHLAQHAVELDNRIKELLAEHAPTLLAEDPGLQKIFGRK